MGTHKPGRRGFRLQSRCYLACALAALVLGACAQPTVEIEPVTIRFAFPEADQVYYEQLAQEFVAQHPGTTIDLLPRSFRAQSPLEPDEADVFAEDMETLYEVEARLLELNPFMERGTPLDLTDLYPGTLEALTSAGRTWAIPAGIDMTVMYYNQDLFDQFGAPYPQPGWTWEDFLASATAASNPDAGLFGYTAIPGHTDALVFIYQHGGSIVDNVHAPTRATFNAPPNIEALEWYRSLFQEYQVAPTPAEARAAFSGGQYAFYQGIQNSRVAMWAMPLSNRGGLGWPMEWMMKWGMVDMPRDAGPTTLAWVEGYAISAQTDHPDDCWAWVVFLSQHMHRRLAPARRSLVSSEAYEQLVGEEAAAMVASSLEGAVLLSPQVSADYAEELEAFDRAITSITEGTLEPWDALERLQEAAEER